MVVCALQFCPQAYDTIAREVEAKGMRPNGMPQAAGIKAYFWAAFAEGDAGSGSSRPLMIYPGAMAALQPW